MKKQGKITKTTKFNEIFENKDAAKILEDSGMHCLGCPMAQFETLEQGAQAHGLDADKLLKEINKKEKKTKRRKKK